MRLAIAGFVHETVTFLPQPTGHAAFEGNARRGAAICETFAGTNSVIGGFLDACAAHGVDTVGLVASECSPSGPVSEEAFARFAEEIVEGVRGLAGQIDGLLLDLHGAMATPLLQDPETELLRRVREAAGPSLPIAVALDLHGNLAPEMLELVQIACGFHHSPHVDMGRTGERAATLLHDTIAGRIRPVMAIRKPGLVLPSIFTATEQPPLSEIMAAARQAETAPGILDISIFTGFAYADVRCIGAAVVVIADGNELAAARAAIELSNMLEQRRHALYREDALLSPPEAVIRAQGLASQGRRPVVILEHADRMNDSTYVLRELEMRRTERVLVPYLCDPTSVQAARNTGVGGKLMTAVGGRSSERAGGAVLIAATVRFVGPKQYACTGPYRTGQPIDLGECAVLDTGRMTLILTSNNVTAVDLDPLLQFGLSPDDFDIVLLRSKTHFRAAWEPVAAEILIVDTPDWGPAQLKKLNYLHVPPGVFPITA